MKQTTTLLALALAALVPACGGDVTASDEYQTLEQEVTTLEEQLAATSAQVPDAVPAEVAAVLDQWVAANERADGSVVELYLPTGYHLYGDQRIPRDEIAAHLGGSEGSTHEWITEPYLIAAEPEGRYVVTRGMRIGSRVGSWASALTFEIVTTADDELRIAQTAWTDATEMS